MAENYEVISQRQTTIVGRGGRLTRVVEITVDVPKANATINVDIPVDNYNADTAKDVIEQRVQDIIAVHNL